MEYALGVRLKEEITPHKLWVLILVVMEYALGVTSSLKGGEI